MTRYMSVALRVGLATAALTVAILWLVDIVWYVFPTAAGLDFSDFLWLAGGAVAGALVGLATGGHQVAVFSALGGIVLVTVAAFVAMPYDPENEGGAPLILFWSIQAVVALLCAAGLVYLVRTLRAR